MKPERAADNGRLIGQPLARFVSVSVSFGRVSNTRFASPSRTSGHRCSAGCNSGVHDGWWCSTTFGGTFSFLAVCLPALSSTNTSTFRPSGSAHPAKSARAWPMRLAFALGRTRNRLRPLLGCANPYTNTDSNLCRPLLVGRFPLSAHTRRTIGLRPSRASSSHHNSTALSG